MMFRHCSMDELLELRDGRGTDTSRGHVAACDACRVELERLHQQRAALKALSGGQAPRDRWPAVREAFLAERRAARRRMVGWSGLAAAAVVLLAVGVSTVGPPAGVNGQAALDSLIDRSQQLDLTLQEVGGRRRVMDGLTALTIAELEDRVALVDSVIDRARTVPAGSYDMRDLFQQRVTLMEALVTSHVQQVSYVGF